MNPRECISNVSIRQVSSASFKQKWKYGPRMVYIAYSSTLQACQSGGVGTLSSYSAFILPMSCLQRLNVLEANSQHIRSQVLTAHNTLNSTMSHGVACRRDYISMSIYAKQPCNNLL